MTLLNIGLVVLATLLGVVLLFWCLLRYALPWWLKRKLAAEGASFTSLVERERLERALSLLRDPKLTLEEIAQRLCYSSVPNFARAFRRWRGETPAQYRRALR